MRPYPSTPPTNINPFHSRGNFNIVHGHRKNSRNARVVKIHIVTKVCVRERCPPFSRQRINCIVCAKLHTEVYASTIELKQLSFAGSGHEQQERTFFFSSVGIATIASGVPPVSRDLRRGAGRPSLVSSFLAQTISDNFRGKGVGLDDRVVDSRLHKTYVKTKVSH